MCGGQFVPVEARWCSHRSSRYPLCEERVGISSAFSYLKDLWICYAMFLVFGCIFYTSFSVRWFFTIAPILGAMMIYSDSRFDPGQKRRPTPYTLFHKTHEVPAHG